MFKGRNLLIISGLVIALFFYFALFRKPSDKAVIESLEVLLPKFAKLRVSAYRNQDWCLVIAYDGKAFANTDQSNCQYVAELPTSAFSPEAQLKIAEVSDLLSAAMVKVTSVEKIHSSGSEITYAEFFIDCEFCRTRYVFNPGYSKLPPDIANELWHYRINENWYRIEEDWN